MPPISKEVVAAAVQTYGEAWTTQDPTLLPSIFTTDAIYVERAYDKNATFRGIDAIIAYWKYQICNKQSDIRFRHVESEMVRDADRPVAVVKWLAEFDNRRENREGKDSNKTYKRVRFCQLAKLIFEGDKICYLEEYVQGMIGPGVRWPGLEATDEELMARIRQDPEVPKAKKMISCNICGAEFPSKTQLFRHLRSTKESRENGIVKCIPIATEEADTFVWVCLSLGYTCNDYSLDDNLERSLGSLASNADDVKIDTLTWAVPPHWTASAVVNVASVKMRKRLVALLNKELEGDDIIIHTAAVVERPCVPERREFERYEALYPWSMLQGENGEMVKIASQIPPAATNTPKRGWGRQGGHRRRPLEETAAARFVDPEIVRRLRDGCRLLKDGGRTDLGHFVDGPGEMKIRLRASTMEEPFQRYCRISVSMKQPAPGYVELFIGLLVAYARSKLTDEDLVAAALRISAIHPDDIEEEEENESAFPFPSAFVCLQAPALMRYESKVGVSLSGDGEDVPESMRNSIDITEDAVLRRIEHQHMLKQTKKAMKAAGFLFG